MLIVTGLCSVPFLRPFHNRKKSMHNLMHTRDSFVAAKARKLYPPLSLPASCSMLFESSFIYSKYTIVSLLTRFLARSYDDITYPPDSRFHNRHYLNYVPRDKFDEFTWSLPDSDIRNGNFDRDEWAFALRRPVLHFLPKIPLLLLSQYINSLMVDVGTIYS